MADSPLHKSPDGLLGALDLKTLGENPRLFSEVLSPIVDTYDQYLANELSGIQVSATIGIGAVGSSATITVPTGQSYRVLAMGGSLTLNVADAAFSAQFNWSVLPRIQSPSVPCLASPLIPPRSAGELSRNWGDLMGRPLYLPSGTRLQMSCAISAAATVAASFSTRALFQLIRT